MCVTLYAHAVADEWSGAVIRVFIVYDEEPVHFADVA